MATAIGNGWRSIDFIDFVKRYNESCHVISDKLIRCPTRVLVSGLSKTYVKGNGASIEFSDARAGYGGIELDNASNIVLSDITISWSSGGARDPIVAGAQRIQSFGNVAACLDKHMGGMLKLDLPVEGVQSIGSVSVWSDNQGWPWYPSASNDAEVYFPEGASVTFKKGQSPCLSELADFTGQRVLLRHIICTNHAFHCLGCRNVTVERMTINSAPGMGFVFENGGSNIALIGNKIQPRCAPLCAVPEPSLTADASHFADVEGPILLERNDFGWQGDDSVNITGLLVPATAPSSDSVKDALKVAQPWNGRLWLMIPGSTVSLYDAGLTKLGESKVVTVDPVNGRISLSWLPAGVHDFILVRTEGVPHNIVIRQNKFHDNRARGILIGGSNALIEHNTIQKVTMEAILIDADTGPWYEGPGAQHVEIRQNTISEVNRFPNPIYPSAISAGVSINRSHTGQIGQPIQDIVIKSNTFSNVFSNPTRLTSAGEGVTNSSF